MSASPAFSSPSMDPAGERSLQQGDIIAGKYRIERVLGEGGMGMVFAATHLQLREPVALKFMNAAALANPEASARFVREARAAARLRGEHVCRVLDLGETDTGDRYIVIEYLDGRDLSEVLAEYGSLTTNVAVDYILQACEAMAEAHGAGIVHRDLKPANLFLTTGTDGAACIKVVDFGISKLINPETNAAVVTTTRSLMGSPLYMAPEQLVSAKEVDARADIWALGTVLFQLISGRTPYQAESLPEVVAQVLHNDPPKLSSLVAASPRKLDAVINRCLRKDKHERYASVADLAADLAEVVPEASHLAMRSAAVLGVARHSTQMPASRAAPRRLYWLGALVIALLGAAAFATVVALSGEKDATAPVPEASASPPTETRDAPPDPVKAATSPDHDSVIEVLAPVSENEAALIEERRANKAKAKKSAARREESAKRARAGKKPAGESNPTAPGPAIKAKKKKSELLEPDLGGSAKPGSKKTEKTEKTSTKPKSDVLDPDL